MTILFMTALPIPLPDGYDTLVSVDDTVTAGQTLATPQKGDEEILDLPQMLNIPKEKVKHVLRKKPGDNVEEGDVIAQKKSFLGLDQDTVVSKVSGIITRYERFTGSLIIQTSTPSHTKKIVSPVDGKVTLCNNEQIVIQTPKHVVLGKNGWGSKRRARLFILEASFSHGKTNVLYHLDNHAIGKVVVGKKFTREMLMKGAGLGIKGIICLHIAPEDREYIQGREQSMPIIQVTDDGIKEVLTFQAAALDGELKTIVQLQV
jgi:hypothetical protein